MTGVRPVTRDFTFLIFTGMNQNKVVFTGWWTGEYVMVLVCFTCNIEFDLFTRLPRVRHMTYSEATSVLYTARLVCKAFCMQPSVR